MKVEWRVLTIGHLSRNKFWGEAEDRAYRTPLATAVLLQANGTNMVVDPSMEKDKMEEALFQRCGLKGEAIQLVYATHFHGDHCMGLEAFPNAQCYMAPEDLAYAVRWEVLDEQVRRRFEPAPRELMPGVRLVNLPGHTKGICGLCFEGPEGRILIAGDSVMNQEYFQAEEGYWYNQDLERSKRTIQQIRGKADIVIPGHGNYFCAKAY